MPWPEPEIGEDVEPERVGRLLPGLLFVTEVSRHLGKSVRTVRRWIALGHLPAVRVGPATYIREADFLALIDAGVATSIARPAAPKRHQIGRPAIGKKF